MVIGVIIPTYNQKDSLKETIESLLDQSYPKNKYQMGQKRWYKN